VLYSIPYSIPIHFVGFGDNDKGEFPKRLVCCGNVRYMIHDKTDESICSFETLLLGAHAVGRVRFEIALVDPGIGPVLDAIQHGEGLVIAPLIHVIRETVERRRPQNGTTLAGLYLQAEAGEFRLSCRMKVYTKRDVVE
jgi:hypothetical protein